MMSETADSAENGEDLSHSKMDLKMDKGHKSFLENGKVSQNDSGFEMTQLDNSAEEFNPDLSTNGISLNLSITKNNESGIDIEKSPLSSAKDSAINSEHSPSLKDCSMLSELDLSECVSESLTDSGNASRTNSVCESEKRHLKVTDQENSQEKLINNCDTDVNKDTAQSVQDSIKCESSDKEGTSVDQGASSATDVAMASKDSDGDSDIKPVSFKKCLGKKRKYRSRRIASDSEKDSDDDDTDKAEERSTRGQQSRMDDEETESELDSDDFSEEEIDDENMESAKSKSDDQKSESEEEEEDQDRPKPRQTWKAIFDLRNREVGFNNKTPPSIFREKVQGSLQMVQRFKLQYKMEYHDGCVNALSFNRIGTLLASGSDDLNVILWNWIKKRPSLVYDSGHRGNVFQAKFMPFSGDCHVVSCARDGQVRLAELSLTGVCKGTKKLAQHKGAAHKLALEYDSPHVFLSCGEDAMVYEIDLRQEKPNKLCQTKLESRKIPLYSIHSNPSNSYEFCVGGRDRYIRIYDKRKIAQSEDGLLKKFCPHHLVDSKSKADVTCAVYNYNGTEILGSYNDDDIYLFNNLHSDEADFIRRYKGHRNSATVKGVNFYGPRSEFVVSGSDCGHVFLWDKETEDVVQFMEGDECGVINVLEPHPFAPVLATSGLDHDVKIWAPTAEEPSVLPNLKTTAKKNKRERDEENTNEPQALQDMLDGPMLYYIMRQISRARRRNDPEGENSSSNDSSESDSEDSDIAPDRLQCAQQ